MTFEDEKNPYFGAGKVTMQKWVNTTLLEYRKDMENPEFEPENAYGVTEKKVYSLILAGGGPSMEVEIDVEKNDKHNNIIGGRFIYSWYTTPEIVELDSTEAETVANYYGLFYE